MSISIEALRWWSQNFVLTACKHEYIMPCIHCTGCWWWCNGVGDVLLAHFGPLSTNWALLKYHSLPEHCFWSCPSLFDHHVPILSCYFQQDKAPCHKDHIISKWFLEHDNESTVIECPLVTRSQYCTSSANYVSMWWVIYSLFSSTYVPNCNAQQVNKENTNDLLIYSILL